ncbi:MAG: erythronate-4-phosphate dehydrogenase, partial [Muribaculaceae bacterium]|nr:erythronate-4-phosphate dehydrogenase [Muribaculaceae bacterium]
MKPKILIDDNIPYIEGRLEPFARVEYVDQFGFNPDNVRDADALIIRTRTRCDSSLLSDSSVRMIATATIGVDQIDIPWCEKAGIKVANSPGCNAPAVAQYVWS